MKEIQLLPKQGNYYKANLHCHTTYSDGELTPEEVKRIYKEQGYAVVAYTDHRQYHNFSHLSDKDFLAISAMEVDINEFGNVQWDFSRIKTYHINLYDTAPHTHTEESITKRQPERKYYDMEYINRYIDEMNAMGFLACYNHPYWSLQSCSDYTGLKGLWGMEIYNYGCELDGLYGYHPQAYDEMLREGQRIFCVASDDNHNSYPQEHPFNDSFGGFTMIYAKELNYPEIMEALKKGLFYSSMGPEFAKITLSGNKLTIKCSPVKKIYVRTQGRNCYRMAASEGELLQEAEFVISGKEGYLRVDIEDEKGRHANTNAWFLDDIMKMQLEEE